MHCRIPLDSGTRWVIILCDDYDPNEHQTVRMAPGTWLSEGRVLSRKVYTHVAVEHFSPSASGSVPCVARLDPEGTGRPAWCTDFPCTPSRARQLDTLQGRWCAHASLCMTAYAQHAFYHLYKPARKLYSVSRRCCCVVGRLLSSRECGVVCSATTWVRASEPIGRPWPGGSSGGRLHLW